jgi:hypothetical protein
VKEKESEKGGASTHQPRTLDIIGQKGKEWKLKAKFVPL